MSLNRLLLLAFCLRLLLPAAALILTGRSEAFETADSAKYLRLAEALVREGRYYDGGEPEIFRPPGYPLILSLGVLVNHPYAVPILLQALLGTLTVYLIYRCALLLIGDKHVAIACGLLGAIEPVLLVWSSAIMAETLLTACVTLAVWALLRHLNDDSKGWLLAAAGATSAAAYVKPIAYFLPLAIATVLLVWAVRSIQLRQRLGHTAIFLAVCLVALAPWHIRNGVASGYYGFSTQIESSIALSKPAAVVAAAQGRPFSEVWQEFHTSQQGPRDSAVYASHRGRGVSIILAALPTYIQIHLRGMGRTLFHPGAIPFLQLFGLHPASGGVDAIILDRGSVEALSRTLRTHPLVFWTTLVFGLWLLPYLLLPALGLLRLKAPGTQWRLMLGGLAAYFVFLAGGPWGQSRFRHPIMPILCVLAGYELARLRRANRVARPADTDVA